MGKVIDMAAYRDACSNCVDLKKEKEELQKKYDVLEQNYKTFVNRVSEERSRMKKETVGRWVNAIIALAALCFIAWSLLSIVVYAHMSVNNDYKEAAILIFSVPFCLVFGGYAGKKAISGIDRLFKEE